MFDSGAIPWGCWVWMELPWQFPERFLGFTYVDPDVGLSAKGGPESSAEVIEQPAFTVRLPGGFPFRVLTAEEVSTRGLPAAPSWLVHYGPQPDPESPWRKDPCLAGLFHERHPNDLQVMVHDGEPRRTQRSPEMCWVRVLRAEQGPARRALLNSEQETPAQVDSPGDTWVYVARLLNVPHQLRDIRQDDELRFISGTGLAHPLHVTEKYLQERANWLIAPCDKCGWSEAFDAPSRMARLRFPEMPPDSEVTTFSAFCPLCGGIQLLTREDVN
ncbi:hypothetical protein [Myxococcus landrumensis]|uniref:Uncharacterized protein n=1 Tax=Myxococcus landrumensis TaxID=2813577 RepID=A0ABX7NFF9_9BACT|nr:hypothetical protein [Myxococcus landrumus]QSQ17562.1 hypothetical protein JY572_16640 [Myxococcus landrumus]